MLTNVKNVTEIRMFKSDEGINVGYSERMLPEFEKKLSIENRRYEFFQFQLKAIDIEHVLDNTKKIVEYMFSEFQTSTLQSELKLFKSFTLD